MGRVHTEVAKITGAFSQKVHVTTFFNVSGMSMQVRGLENDPTAPYYLVMSTVRMDTLVTSIASEMFITFILNSSMCKWRKRKYFNTPVKLGCN